MESTVDKMKPEQSLFNEMWGRVELREVLKVEAHNQLQQGLITLDMYNSLAKMICSGNFEDTKLAEAVLEAKGDELVKLLAEIEKPGPILSVHYEVDEKTGEPDGSSGPTDLKPCESTLPFLEDGS